MSYILEALKKSEQERQRGNVPDLQTVQEELPEEASRQKIWPYLLAAGVIAANIAAFVLLPNSQDDTRLAETKTVIQLPLPEIQPPAPEIQHAETLPTDSQEESQATPIIATDPSLKKAPIQTAPKPVPQPTPSLAAIVKTEALPQASILAESPAPPVTVPTAPQLEPIATPQPQQAATPKKTTPRPALVKRKTAIIPAGRSTASARRRPRKKRAPSADLDWLKESETARLNKNKVFSLEELPSSVTSDLPEFNISAHFYANNPRRRMLSLNGSIVRQGQTVSRGLRLEEITKDGAIFKYRDIRFKVDVF